MMFSLALSPLYFTWCLPGRGSALGVVSGCSVRAQKPSRAASRDPTGSSAARAAQQPGGIRGEPAGTERAPQRGGQLGREHKDPRKCCVEELVNRPLEHVHYTGRSAGAGEGTRSPALGLDSPWQGYLHPRGAKPAPWGLPCPFDCLGQAAGLLQGELFPGRVRSDGVCFPSSRKALAQSRIRCGCVPTAGFSRSQAGWSERSAEGRLLVVKS